MHFLELPEDIITDIFAQIDQEWYSDRIATFRSLRLVCKTLASRAEASVFSSLLVRLEGASLSSLSKRSSEIGKHAKKLELDLVVDITERDWGEKLQLAERDQQLAVLLSNLPNIRDITVHLFCNKDLLLEKTESALPAVLRQVQYANIFECMDPAFGRTTGMPKPSTDTFVSTLARYSGSTLLSLSIDSMRCLQPSTFVALREHGSQLRALVFRFSIGLDLRDTLCQQVPWACRKTLEHLAFHCCRGGHAGAIACGIASGLWAQHLKSLEVSACGDPGDLRKAPYPLTLYEKSNFDSQAVSQSNTNVLEVGHYEHESLWELQLLGRLPIKQASMTQISRVTITELLEEGFFPELKRLKVAKVDSLPTDTADNERFAKGCVRRDIQSFSDAEEVGQCFRSD